MFLLKIIATINWALISTYAAGVLWILPQQGSGTGHEMSGVGSLIKGVAVFLLIVLIGLNWLPYAWTKIVVLLIEVLLLLLLYYFFTN
ncbi:hypothetical protein [Spirosoma flavum]|uniref:Uncharacterized protein n=1 Tax=Spirosoma flavum TaxID=2048557 RepID=A0ABW6AHU3_9BACT